MMKFFLFSGLVNALAVTLVGFFVYLKNKKVRMNQAFGLFCLSMAIWSYAYCFWPIAQTKAVSLLSFQILHIGAILIPVSYLYFVLDWLGFYEKRKGLIKFGYILALTMCPFVFTPLFIKDMVPKFIFKYWAEPGILYHFFLLYFFTYAIYTICLLVSAHKKSSGDKRKQIQYILLGTILGYLGGATNYPLWYNIPIYPLINWTSALYVFLVAYAILRYRLFDMKIILTQFVVFVLWIATFIKLFLARGWQAISIEGGFLIFLTIFGILLIRSVLREVQQREKLEVLTKNLEAANEKLKELDKTKSEFLSFASHQVKSPMTIVKGYATLIADGTLGEAPKEIKETAEKIKNSADRMISLVNNLLDLRKIEEGRMDFNFEETNIVEVVKNIAEEFKKLAKDKKLELIFESSKDEIKTKIDTQKFSQVIQNLIDNAIKYTEKGFVKINIKTSDVQKFVLITISDSGRGISKELMSKMFEQFSRDSSVKKEIQGTGLGLYIAKQIVLAHQGQIWVESEGEGRGSKFFVELPAV